MFRKTWYSLLAVLVVSTMILTACGGGDSTADTPDVEDSSSDSSADEGDSADSSADESGDEDVTVTWWHIQTEESQRALWEQLANEYMAEHPNVTIEITVLENEQFKTKLTTVMQSGDPPDIFQSWGGGVMNEYAEAGLLQSIDAALDQDGWRETFSPGALGVYAYDGVNYGVPRDMGMVGFWYNKELFAEAGIDAPPTTWEELLADVEALQDAGITPIAVGEGDKWPGAFWWEYLAVRLGGEEAFLNAITREGSFADAPFVEAGEMLQTLVEMDAFQSGFLGATWGDEATAMANGNAAMDLMGQWAPGAFIENSSDGEGLGDALGWFPFPAIEGGEGAPADALGGGNGYVIGVNAPPEAVDFLKYLSSVDSQIAQAELGMSVPVVAGGEAGLSDPQLLAVQEGAAAAEYFQLYYDQYLPPAVGPVVNDAVQGIFAGTLTPEEAAQMIDDAYVAEIQ